VKLEGDAVFCYVDAETFRGGERLVELIEACYFDFSNRPLDMARATTCRCNACAAIGSLGLKFIAHYGDNVIERDHRREDLAGADVILIHRLLKNKIGESGPQAYAFSTEACLQRLPQTFTLPRHTETSTRCSARCERTTACTLAPQEEPNAEGRLGAGALVMARPVIETIEFAPLGDRGTRIVIRYREIDRNPVFRLVSKATHLFLKAFWRRRGAELARIAQADPVGMVIAPGW